MEQTPQNPNQQLVDYVQQARASGMQDGEIQQELLRGGWPSEQVLPLFGVPTPSSTALPSKKGFHFKLLLSGVVIIVLIGVGLFILKPFSKNYPPKLSAVPTIRTLSPAQPSSGVSIISYKNLSISLPWTDVEQKKELQTGVLTDFSSGMRVAFSDGVHFLETWKQEQPGTFSEYQSHFGKDFSSDYDYYNLLLTTTPESLKTASGKEAEYKNKLLALRTDTTSDSTPIYEFSNINGIRGFQFGDPQNIPSNTAFVTEIFDSQNTHYTLVLKGGVSQNDVDFILSSIKETDK